MKAEHHFAGSASSVRAARAFITEKLANTPKSAVEDAVLIASELAANAVTHANSAFTICVEETTSHVRIEVRDRGEGAPTLRRPRPEEAYGRGLRIVSELARSWGVDEHPEGGKTVWADIALPNTGRATL
ncbi:MAG: ATP-binding protein [Actinobacteria bacterium]|nr:ATP-binding protein [Actinomycetota bacterium]